MSDATFDADELSRRAKTIEVCKPILDDTMDEKLDGGGLTNEAVKCGHCSSLSRAGLFKENIVAVLQKQMAMSSSRDVISRFQDVFERTEHFFGMLSGLNTHRKVCDKTMASRNSDVW